MSPFICVIQVIFQNETTGEFQFYHVHFKSVPSGIISTIDLTTAVRQSVSHTITIDNPFPIPLNMTTSVNVPDISMPANFLIGAESQVETYSFIHIHVPKPVFFFVIHVHVHFTHVAISYHVCLFFLG